MQDYNPLSIEDKWLSYWKSHESDHSESNKENPLYVLEMFPYPSGALHMGHVRNYTIGDTFTRFKRMNNYDVIYPMGYDSFGLPAENAAVKHSIHPENWTLDNIKNMEKQQRRLGLSYDWSRKVTTCLPDYYRWNQWIFLKMYEKGLVYRKKGFVNWDPIDETVLANEQVIEGKGWRSGADIEQKEIEQWYLKITDYADELLDDIDRELIDWPDRVKSMQKNWIGRSVGCDVSFSILTETGFLLDEITTFTTRVDTLFGVTYLVLAPDHNILEKLSKKNLIKNISAIHLFHKKIQENPPSNNNEKLSKKRGLKVEGIVAVNPINNKQYPIFIADYVVSDYGTGAVMAVPAHDQRDFEFAKEHGLPINQVISSEETLATSLIHEEALVKDGYLINSDSFSGLSSQEARIQITEWLSSKSKGKKRITYRLRDWLISRQRYWGTPIPMLYDKEGNILPVNESDLPVRLPQSLSLSGKGNPLSRSSSFLNVEKDGVFYKRETDTMDTFFDSSWYFFRYCDPKNNQLPFDQNIVNNYLPVDYYIGGVEHAVLHLLYARFFTKVLRDLNLTNVKEPFKRVICQGMVLKDGKKMSKSLGNTIDPSVIIDNYGADTARIFILFGAPVEKDLDWSDDGVKGAFRFLRRVYVLFQRYTSEKVPETSHETVERKQHLTIKQVSIDIERFQFNTAISRLMEYVTVMHSYGATKENLSTLILMLAPFAPFITEELWSILGHNSSIHQEKWPSFIEEKIIQDTITVVVQINGKRKELIQIERDLDQESVVAFVMSNTSKSAEILKNKTIRKIIYIPNKLINFAL